VLSRHGLHRVSLRLFGRIADGIFQSVSLNKSIYGSGDFNVSYSSMTLFLPREAVVARPGDRLRAKPMWGIRMLGLGAEKWWSSYSEPAAEEAMTEAIELIETQAIPFFKSTQTVRDQLKMLSRRDAWTSEHHRRFDQGACRCRLGRIDDALADLKCAEALYQEDGRDWCAPYLDQVRALMRACGDGTSAHLLSDWEQESIRRLRLERLNATKAS
jgi:hypothetical protein